MRSSVSKRGGQGKISHALRTTYAKALLAVGIILCQFSQSLFCSFALMSGNIPDLTRLSIQLRHTPEGLAEGHSKGFQQDEVLSHYYDRVIWDWLKESFQSQIECHAQVELASSSPILKPLDDCLCGIPKTQVSSVKIRDTNNFRQNFPDTCVRIDRNGSMCCVYHSVCTVPVLCTVLNDIC